MTMYGVCVTVSFRFACGCLLGSTYTYMCVHSDLMRFVPATEKHRHSLKLIQVSDAVQAIMLTSGMEEPHIHSESDDDNGNMLAQPAAAAAQFTPADRREIGQLRNSTRFARDRTHTQTNNQRNPHQPATTVQSKRKSQRVRFWDELDARESESDDSDMPRPPSSPDTLDSTLGGILHSRDGLGPAAQTPLDQSEGLSAPDATLHAARRTISRMQEEIRRLRQQQFEQQFESRREQQSTGSPGSMAQLQNLQKALNR